MDILRAFLLPKGRQGVSGGDGVSVPASCHVLLVQALECLRSERYTDGIALLRHSREQLPSEHTGIVPIIDTIMQGYSEYVQAQEKLFAASRHFASVDSEQQTRFLRLEQLLSQQERQENAPVYPLVQQITQLHTSSAADDSQKGKQVAAPAEAHRPDGIILQQKDGEGEQLPPLHTICFGRFTAMRGSELLTLCQNRNGQAILRYLVAQANHRATIDTLMETFWPDDEPETARRKLQVAVSALRRTLNQGYDCSTGGGYILCKGQYYQINPSVSITSDVAEFLTLYEQGRLSSGQATIWYYEQACRLYTGTYFVEDIYADWSCKRREQCSLAYSTMCNILSEHALTTGNYDAAVHWANLVLAENRYDEAASRLLMQIYATQGRRIEVIRQYQRCERELNEELGIAPMPETTRLFHSLLATDKQ